MEPEEEETMTAKTTRAGVLSMIIGGAIGYVAARYLTGANGTSHGLVGLVGGATPMLVALIRVMIYVQAVLKSLSKQSDHGVLSKG